MKTFNEYVNLSESLRYCQENDVRLSELYRVGSEAYYECLNLARTELLAGKIKLHESDKAILEETEIGKFALYEGSYVPLDSPMINEDDENVELNKPKRGGNKKYYVHVRNDKGNVVKVEFGDPDMSVKLDDEEARKSFVARHKCSEKKDKTTPGYWACRIPRYADSLGLSGGGNFFW